MKPEEPKNQTEESKNRIEELRKKLGFPAEEDILKEAETHDVYKDFLGKAGKRAKKLKKKLQRLKEKDPDFKPDPKISFETHHILPIHEGGSDDPENLVLLIYEDHTLAHYIRWVLLKKPAAVRRTAG